MKFKLAFLHVLRPNRSLFLLKKQLLVFLLLMITSSAFAQTSFKIGTVSELYNTVNSSNGRIAKGSTNIKHVKLSDKESIDISVKTYSKKGKNEIITASSTLSVNTHVFFQFKNGEVTGKITVPEKKIAYLYSSSHGNVVVKKEKIDKVICTELVKVKSTSNAASSNIKANASTYSLESLPGATAVVLLDFNGQNVVGSWWGDIDAQAPNVLEQDIEGAWKSVSEDFRPFNLNITTSESVYQAAPVDRRMRVIFTPTTTAYPGSGGVAYISTFTVGGELAPCWVFNVGDYGDGGKIMGETASHEIGHTMGLLHDGQDVPNQGHEEYYGGQGIWAPIMGVGYYKQLTQWSIGEYRFATNHEDDISIMVTQNGFGFRSDVQGNTMPTAAPLVVSNGNVLATLNNGVITNNQDVDFFSFSTTGGLVNLMVSQSPDFPDLDVLATLYNQQGQVVSVSDPDGITAASFTNLTLGRGNYYIAVKGTGSGDFTNTGYTNYASVGEYSISGNFSNDVKKCNEYVQQLTNGDIKFSVSYSAKQAYVEVFAQKNNIQHLASNITSSEVHNLDGTYTYNYILSGSYYTTGDVILARYYSYATNSPGVFTPGPSETVWSQPFIYNETKCVVDPTSTCKDYIQQLVNGDIKFVVTYSSAQFYVELFATKNGQQNTALNIVNSQVSNADGTFSYSYITPAAGYVQGSIISARFYSYKAGAPGVFTPGPSETVWSAPFTYGVTLCSGSAKLGSTSSSSTTSTVLVYPNPVLSGGEFFIALEAQTENQKIRLFDLNGLLVSEQLITNEGNVVSFNVKGIEPGVYVLDLGNHRQKIVIQ